MNWTYFVVNILQPNRLRPSLSASRFAVALLAFVLAWLTLSPSVSAVSLYWSSTSGADGIQIERATAVGGPWSQIATVGGTATNYQDTAISCGVDYYYRIRAYNSAGESGYSNVAGPASTSCCSYSITPLTAAMPAGGGSNSISVSVASGCAWTASSNVGWITIASGGSGTGNGTVNYIVAPNTTSTELTGTITIADQTFTVTEDAVACAYTLSASSATYDSSGGSDTVNVATDGSCDWTAVSNVGWITITSGSSGTGTGVVSYSVSANTSAVGLTGTLTIAGQTFTVTEGGVPCTYALSATSAAYSSSGGGGSISVSAPGGCVWTASSNVGWITITSGGSGTGNGTVNYSVSANTTSVGLTGTLTIAGQTFTVTEDGVACTYALSQTSASYSASGGGGSVGVAAPGGCAWTAASSVGWITITAGNSGTGNGMVSYSVAPNTSTNGLTGAITIAGQTFTVLQGGVVIRRVAITNAVDTVDGLPVVMAGETVSFNAGTVSDNTTPLTYAWDFGDGSTSTDSAPDHAFADCGPHTVTVAISDGITTTNANFKVSVPCAMSVTNFRASVNFPKPNLDKCSFKAVPQPSQCTNWLGTIITLDVGGAQVTFTLDAKGRGVSTNGTCRFSYNKRAGVCQLTARLSHGSWHDAWAQYGLVNADTSGTTVSVTLPVTLVISDEVFMAEKPLRYTAAANKSGTAK